MQLDSIREKLLIECKRFQSDVGRYWSVEKKLDKVNGICPHGATVSHSFLIEIPTINIQLDINIENSLHNIKKLVYIDSVYTSYSIKVLLYNYSSFVIIGFKIIFLNI